MILFVVHKILNTTLNSFFKYKRLLQTCSRREGTDIPQLHYLFYPYSLPPLVTTTIATTSTTTTTLPPPTTTTTTTKTTTTTTTTATTTTTPPTTTTETTTQSFNLNNDSFTEYPLKIQPLPRGYVNEILRNGCFTCEFTECLMYDTAWLEYM